MRNTDSIDENQRLVQNIVHYGTFGIFDNTLYRGHKSYKGDKYRTSGTAEPRPTLVSSLLDSSISQGLRGCLHQAHDAGHPPVAGHDDSTCHPAAAVVVRVRVVPPQRLADPLAVGVAAAALVTADALVVQHRVDVHGALLALQAALRGEGEDSGQRAHSVCVALCHVLYVFSAGEDSSQTN